MKLTFEQLVRAFTTCDDEDTWIGGVNPDGSIDFVLLGDENPMQIGDTWFENVGVCLDSDGMGTQFHGQVMGNSINAYFEIVECNGIPSNLQSSILMLNDERTHALVITEVLIGGLPDVYLSERPEITDLVTISLNTTAPGHAGAVTEISAVLVDCYSGREENLISLAVDIPAGAAMNLDHVTVMREKARSNPVMAHHYFNDNHQSKPLALVLIELQEWMIQATKASTNELAVRFESGAALKTFEALYRQAGFDGVPEWVRVGVSKTHSKPDIQIVETPVCVSEVMTVNSAYRALVLARQILSVY